ncbi:MAG TPA: MFS transporter [Ktedonobacterales bacterium]|jgi:CP family cyanate transporter-like MFS transporter|nr:MFS transporter [Ktedonobacterales bacterium]
MVSQELARHEYDERITDPRRVVLVLALIGFVGINLRSVLLAVPPILPQIQYDLGLSYTATGLLTSLPTLIMGGLALPSGLVAGRLGASRAVTLGLFLLASGALLRAIWPAALPLYLFTFLLSLGIALAQTAVPVLIRQWFPQRIGFVAALYTDGLILGEALAAALTASVVLGVLGANAWTGTFVIWSLPVFLALALWLWLAPPAAATISRRPRGAVAESLNSSKLPIRRRGVSAWQLGLLMGGASLIFFGMNTWIPSYNTVLGSAAATPLALGVLNAIQLPVGLVLTAFAQRLAGRRWPFILAGTICVLAIAGMLATPVALQPLWVALLGAGSACVFVLGIALPPLLASREEVAQLTGATLSVSYGTAFVGPLAGGALWDLFAAPQLAFAPVAAAGVAMIVLGALLPSRTSVLPEQSATAFLDTTPGVEFTDASPLAD